MIRVVLIDPVAAAVTEHTVQLDLDKLYELLACDNVEAFRYRNEFCYCDGRGRLHDTGDDLVPYCWLKGADYPVVGRIMIVGKPDHEGNETSCRLSREEVEAWVDRYERGPKRPVPPPRIYVRRDG